MQRSALCIICICIICIMQRSAPINSRLNVVVRSLAPFGLGRNGCWPSRGSQLPWTLSFIFSLCCPLNDRKRVAHSFFKIDRLFSLFLFSCPSLALLRLLILLLLLMSGNVHPNPGPIFPWSVCAVNVTWRGKSVQRCTCSKWVHLRCSQLSLSQFRALGSSHSWSISASRRASSVIAKAEAWQTTCSSLSPKSNLESIHSVLRSIAGSPSSSSSSPIFPNCSSPRESASVYAAYLRSHFSVSQPEATSLSSAEPRAWRSLTRPFALLSHSLNFLRLPPTSPPPPPLVQTKLPIPC